MARQHKRKGEQPVIVERPDHQALFIEAGRKIYLAGAVLDAYRRSMGVHVQWKRTAVARETLDFEISRAIYSFDGLGSMSDAYAHAGRMAMKAYLGQWWSHTLADYPLSVLGPGDEFFNKYRVIEIIENHHDFTPSLKG